MSVILNKADKFIFLFLAAIAGIKIRIANEIRRIKNDERGIEVVQVILILVIVIIIAVALWFLLKDLITEWIDRIVGESEKLGDDPLYGG